MDPNTGDVDRMMEGLMVMGGEVLLEFYNPASSGHYLEYVMIPPSFATVLQLILQPKFSTRPKRTSETGAEFPSTILQVRLFSAHFGQLGRNSR